MVVIEKKYQRSSFVFRLLVFYDYAVLKITEEPKGFYTSNFIFNSFLFVANDNFIRLEEKIAAHRENKCMIFVGSFLV